MSEVIEEIVFAVAYDDVFVVTTYGCKLGAQKDFNSTQVMTYMRHGNLDMALWYSDQWGERRHQW